jgi:hypothetical protein
MAYSLPGQAPLPRIQECFQTQVAITPTDNTPIGPYVALYVGGAGNVTLCPRNSTTPVAYAGLAAGTILRVAFQGVNATGTTATNLVGLG